jgi:hypothetical protein
MAVTGAEPFAGRADTNIDLKRRGTEKYPLIVCFMNREKYNCLMN